MGKKKLLFQRNQKSIDWSKFLYIETTSTSTSYEVNILNKGDILSWKTLLNGVEQPIIESNSYNGDISANSGVAELTGADASKIESLAFYSDTSVSFVDMSRLSTLLTFTQTASPSPNCRYLFPSSLESIEINALTSTIDTDFNSATGLKSIKFGSTSYFNNKGLLIDECINLETISIDRIYNLGLLDISNKPKLKNCSLVRTNASGDSNGNFDFSTSNNIQTIYLAYVTAGNLIVSGCDKLVSLSTGNPNNTVFDLTDCVSLSLLYSWSRKVTSFIYPSNPIISLVDLVNTTAITDAKFNELPQCESIKIRSAYSMNVCNLAGLTLLTSFINYTTTGAVGILTNIDFSTNINLTTIQIYRTGLNSLDISNNPLITTLHCYNNGTMDILDDVVIQLDTNGLSNGDLRISASYLTTASDVAISNLVDKGWSITY